MSVEALLAWFEANARVLPWRGSPRDPYLVLVSEIMLQQTQVDRVIPRFVEFADRFPNFNRLAAASEEEVLTLWSGLGYYRRARMLHRLAREVLSRGGKLPSTAAELETLPGVGPYTAAAVASLAFGEGVPVLDGNVMRVGARVLAMTDDPRSAAGRTGSRKSPGAWGGRQRRSPGRYSGSRNWGWFVGKCRSPPRPAHATAWWTSGSAARRSRGRSRRIPRSPCRAAGLPPRASHPGR